MRVSVNAQSPHPSLLSEGEGEKRGKLVSALAPIPTPVLAPVAPFCLGLRCPKKRDQGGALFEAIAEFAPTPVFLGQRRSPEAERRDSDSRVAFFAYFFGEAKK